MIIQLVDRNEGMCNAWRLHFSECKNITIHQGDFFELPTDCVVSPANSFGFMDGGLDALITKRFGSSLQLILQEKIRMTPLGELLVGEAMLIETGDNDIPFLISAPTMRVPMILTNTVNVYLASKAIFNILNDSEGIDFITISGLGTGVGQVPYDVCARQMRAAYNEIWTGEQEFPVSWYKAQRDHQLLYTTSTKDLQH